QRLFRDRSQRLLRPCANYCRAERAATLAPPRRPRSAILGRRTFPPPSRQSCPCASWPYRRERAHRQCCASAAPAAEPATSLSAWRAQPSANPGAKSWRRSDANRLAATHTKSMLLSRAAWLPRSQLSARRRAPRAAARNHQRGRCSFDPVPCPTAPPSGSRVLVTRRCATVMAERSIRRKARSQKGEGLAQVGDDLTGWLALLEFAGSDENAQSDSSSCASFHVAHLVANDRAVNRIKPKIRYSLQEHSGIWFAPGMIAAVLANALHRVMRTVIDAAAFPAF